MKESRFLRPAALSLAHPSPSPLDDQARFTDPPLLLLLAHPLQSAFSWSLQHHLRFQ